MAKNPVCHSFNYPVILRFAESIEKSISANPAILSSNIQKFLGPEKETAYLKGFVLFMDSSALDFTIFAKESCK